MTEREKMAGFYANAKEFIKLRNPAGARAYVLAILNAGWDIYNNSTSIISRVRTEIFLRTWAKVSQDLRQEGITDYVLQCFDLPITDGKNEPMEEDKPFSAKTKKPLADDAIDMDGLKGQYIVGRNWCADVFSRNKGSVCKINVSNEDQRGSGTGVIISREGYLLTNDHVVFCDVAECYYERISMTVCGTEKEIDLEVIGSNKVADIALCRFDKTKVDKIKAIEFVPDYSSVQQGEDCVVIGNAYGMGIGPTTGVIRQTKDESGNLVYTAPCNPGDSGGPVLNSDGKCIGIHKSQTTSINGHPVNSFYNATPMSRIDELLKQWCGTNDITL